MAGREEAGWRGMRRQRPPRATAGEASGHRPRAPEAACGLSRDTAGRGALTWRRHHWGGLRDGRGGGGGGDLRGRVSLVQGTPCGARCVRALPAGGPAAGPAAHATALASPHAPFRVPSRPFLRRGGWGRRGWAGRRGVGAGAHRRPLGGSRRPQAAAGAWAAHLARAGAAASSSSDAAASNSNRLPPGGMAGRAAPRAREAGRWSVLQRLVPKGPGRLRAARIGRRAAQSARRGTAWRGARQTDARALAGC